MERLLKDLNPFFTSYLSAVNGHMYTLIHEGSTYRLIGAKRTDPGLNYTGYIFISFTGFYYQSIVDTGCH